MYDLIIIGSGPAGLSAAIYAKRAGLNSLMIEKTGMSGGQMISTYEVDNYPGLPGISGFDLGMKMDEHAKKLGVPVINKEVTAIRASEEKHTVICTTDSYETKGVILANGAVHAKLQVEGEDAFLGKGVSYCATCDGAFFRQADVAVVGGGDVALEDAVFLARFCRKVYLIHRRNQFRGARILQEKVKSLPNIHCIYDTVVEQINGEEKVNSISIYNREKDERRKLPVSGVFIAVGMIPNSDIYKDLIKCDDAGYVIAGEDCRSSRKGIYAAGDIRTKSLRQVITAAADGANAVTSFQQDFLL